MYTILLVSKVKAGLSELSSALETNKDVNLLWTKSGTHALDMVSDTPVHLVLTDEELEDMTGLNLARELLRVNPMINCAAVSPLSPDDFHEASEGLGLMAQLPPHPGPEQAGKLIQRLKELQPLK